MRPTFLGFETAKSSIFHNQKSIDITMNNMANSKTAGYTRQRVEVASISSSRYSSRVASSRVGLAGQGAEALGVSQVRDSFLDKRFRDEYTKTTYHDQAFSLLSDIQSSLLDGADLTEESALSGALAQIFNSINDYAQDSTSDAQANIVMSAFKNITQVLQQLDSKLTSVGKQQIFDLGVNVDRTNEIASQLANLNALISGDATVVNNPNNEHYRPNELLDQRNLLLDELASYGNIDVTERADGTVDVDFAGRSLVKGKETNAIKLFVNDDQTVSIKWQDTGKEMVASGGLLRGATDFLNGRGANIQSGNETPLQGIPYYRDRLDTFAGALVQVANNSIPVADADGNPLLDASGQIVYKTLLGASKEGGGTNAKAPISAGNISVSQEWTQGGAAYFIYSKTENLPKYAQSISDALTSKSFRFSSYGEAFTGTFEEYVGDYASKLGSDVAYHEGRRDASATVADDFLDRRDSVSGTDQDEETANMLMYQKSYEAAARVMTTLDDLLDVVINRMGRVGL